MDAGTAVQDSPAVADLMVRFAQSARSPGRHARTSSPLLAAVDRAGTAHIYADTADVSEVGALVTTGDGAVVQEVDGNTANQPLVYKVIARYLQEHDVPSWARELRARSPQMDTRELAIALYAVLCCRISNDMLREFGSDRPWEISVQLHMALGGDPGAAKSAGRVIRRMVPQAFVKVPFTPQAPHCFLVARDLEAEGIPVNFTSTFSARQALAAGLLANVTRTNIFMGRINQGLKAALLGEHVDLAAQRALLRQRRDAHIKTQLIVASVREWQTFVHAAGCDVFTAPCEAIRTFLQQTDVPAGEIRSQLDTSYEDKLGIADEVLRAVGGDRIARLYAVEPELVQFLTELRGSADYRAMHDGDQLYKRFDQAGFGDLFYSPTAAEWQELRKSKLPDLASPLTRRLPMDTLYTLLADADFEKYQDEMDALIAKRVGG